MWFWIWISLLWAAPVESPIALAAKLASDGNNDRALSVLQQVDEAKLGKEAALYRSTLGLIAMQQHKHADALVDFERALALIEEGQEGPESTLLHLYIGQCHLKMSNPQLALESLQKADQEKASTHILTIQAHRDLANHAKAWSLTNSAITQFPAERALRLAKIELALMLNQLQAVRAQVTYFSEAPDTTAKELLQIAAECRNNNALDEAALYLRAGRYRFTDEELWKASAVIALQQERWVEAGEILQVMAVKNPIYAVEAAEAYRQAALLDRAFLQNGFAPPSPEKTRQRMSLLLEKQHFERVIALEPRLEHWELINEDPIRYGLAYAHYHIRNYDTALGYLKGISDQAVFQQAIGLRRAIESCMEQGC